MNRVAMSAPASALLRILIERSGLARDRILLTDIRSTDWQSLTFVGERHELCLRIVGPDSRRASARLCDGLDDAEFTIPGQIVADITVLRQPAHAPDGSISLAIEALTVAE